MQPAWVSGLHQARHAPWVPALSREMQMAPAAQSASLVHALPGCVEPAVTQALLFALSSEHFCPPEQPHWGYVSHTGSVQPAEQSAGQLTSLSVPSQVPSPHTGSAVQSLGQVVAFSVASQMAFPQVQS